MKVYILNDGIEYHLWAIEMPCTVRGSEWRRVRVALDFHVGSISAGVFKAVARASGSGRNVFGEGRASMNSSEK